MDHTQSLIFCCGLSPPVAAKTNHRRGSQGGGQARSAQRDILAWHQSNEVGCGAIAEGFAEMRNRQQPHEVTSASVLPIKLPQRLGNLDARL